MPSETTIVPDDLLELQQRLDQWRGSQPALSRIPEAFWVEAVEMARLHGLHPAAKVLRMDYMRLKKRLADGTSSVPRSTAPGFLELLAPATGLTECVVELESAGGKMRVATKGMSLDWGGLLRAWREAVR